MVIIRGNNFYRNMGTFGGAITINSPNWQSGNEPYIVIFDNKFQNNMAYFSGNGVYMRNTKLTTDLGKICGGALIQQNNFY